MSETRSAKTMTSIFSGLICHYVLMAISRCVKGQKQQIVLTTTISATFYGSKVSGVLGAGEIPFRIHDLTVPRTGSLFCSARIVDTSRSIAVATSSSFAMRDLVSKCGASVSVSGFFAREASIFPKTAS